MMMLAWLCSAATAQQDAVTPAVLQRVPSELLERRWVRAARPARAGVVTVAIAGGVGVGVGLWSIAAPQEEALYPVNVGLAAAATLGTGLMGAGGIGACAALRREGERCPTWAGFTTFGVGAASVALAVADPEVPAIGWGPASLDHLVDLTRYASLPFAIVQLDTAARRAEAAGYEELPQREGLLDLAVGAGPGRVWLVGAF